MTQSTGTETLEAKSSEIRVWRPPHRLRQVAIAISAVFAVAALLLSGVPVFKPQYRDSIGSPRALALTAVFWGVLTLVAFYVPSPRNLSPKAKRATLAALAILILVLTFVLARFIRAL